MSKKQLLTESEMRRFMALANLEPLTDRTVKENYGVGGMEDQEQEELEEMYSEDSMEEPAMDSSGEETLDLPDEAGQGGGMDSLSPDEIKKAEEVLSVMFGKEIKIDSEAGEQEEPAASPVDNAEEADEEGEEEEEEEEEEGDEEEGEEEEEMDEVQNPVALQEQFIENVLKRVTSRLMNEAKEAAKKGKKVVGKKGGVAAKMAHMRDKAKAKKGKSEKVNEANAPAPKSTNSNGPKKGAGSATKGNFGVTSKVASQEWKAGKEGKGSHELETVSASTEHMITHGKTNLATKGKK